MFVPCPECGFLVALIVSRDGSPQHCPRCRAVLEPTAVASGAGDASLAATSPATQTAEPGATPPEPAIGASGAATGGAGVQGAVRATGPITIGSTGRRAPSFVRHTGRPPIQRSRRIRIIEGTIVTALLLLLCVQMLFAQRNELAASERWRPWVAVACGIAGCSLPAWREPEAYTMLSRSVTPSPTRPGVLEVEASFRNDARWPQHWPHLLLMLSDVNGRPVAQRTFTPDDYQEQVPGDGTLAPGQSASVRLEVVEPADPTVAFTFDFR